MGDNQTFTDQETVIVELMQVSSGMTKDITCIPKVCTLKNGKTGKIPRQRKHQKG